MYELLWMLLPVAAGLGWLAGRRSNGNETADSLWPDARSYHRDLHLLLSDRDHDNTAPDSLEFDSLGNADHDAAETHLALGNLFRRRGDVDRAIRVHGSLLGKNELSDELRAEARLELARDYDSAGLLDRSEEQFGLLLKDNQHVDACYENLLSIFERGSEWQRAIETAKEYQSRGGVNMGHRIAHYYCELAQNARRENNLSGMKKYLADALAEDRECARANMLHAELAMQHEDYHEAIRRYEMAEKQRPELAPEVISPLFDALERLDDSERLREFIQRIRHRFNAYSVIRRTRDAIEKLDGQSAADLFFKEQIVKRPSLKGLRDWARGQLERSRPGERENVGVMCDMLDRVVEDKPGYLCESCGFRAQALHWRCPGCSSWDTVATVIGAEGE